MRLSITKIVLGFGLALTMASTAQAQATRTWVSGVGDDANPCSRTAPCKTFAGAISKTADGGYINVLDSGGFGAVTITKGITIDGEGAHAGILGSLTNGIVINAPGRRVTLRNLAIESGSVTNLGLNGIRVLAATEVHVENVWIAHFGTRAVDWDDLAGGEGFFNNVTIINNGTNSGDGMVFESGRHVINRLHAESNGGSAVQARNTAIVTVRNSYAVGGTSGFAAGFNNTAILNVENCTASHNSHGIFASSGATVRVSNSMIVSNLTNGLFNDGTATIISMSGNVVTGNPNNGVFNGPLVVKQ
jgi:hypothetical protein